MRTMKRPAAAAASPQPAAKRAPDPGVKTVSKQCNSVAKAVLAVPGYPGPVLEMISTNILESLGVAKEKRHRYQERVVGMIGEVLKSAESEIQASIEKAEKHLGEAGSMKAERESAENSAEAEHNDSERAVGDAVTSATEAALALTTAQEALAAAQAAKKDGQAELDKAERQKMWLVTSLSGYFMPLKEGLADRAKVKEALEAVMTVGQEFSFDPTMMNSVPTAVGKAPSERGSFDNLVMQQVETEFRRCIKGLETKLDNAEPSKKEREDAVEKAAAELEKVKAHEEECKNALEAAKAAAKAKSALKQAASQALKQLGPELRTATNELGHAKAKLDALRDGPMTAFQALLERTEVVPEEAAAEAEVAPESEVAPAA